MRLFSRAFEANVTFTGARGQRALSSDIFMKIRHANNVFGSDKSDNEFTRSLCFFHTITLLKSKKKKTKTKTI